MSIQETTVPARQKSAPFARRAVAADYAAIRGVLKAAYAQYADLIPHDIFSRYLADLLNLEEHARHGPLLVVQADDQIRGFAAFQPDASARRVGWPPGWATGRALAVHPAARGHGVARVLAAACERLARDSGSPVFAFHTYGFMTSAIALYESLGYRRAPEFDLDMTARFGGDSAAPITALAYLRCLTRTRADLDGVPATRCLAEFAHPDAAEPPMTTCRSRTRRHHSARDLRYRAS